MSIGLLLRFFNHDIIVRFHPLLWYRDLTRKKDSTNVDPASSLANINSDVITFLCFTYHHIVVTKEKE